MPQTLEDAEGRTRAPSAFRRWQSTVLRPRTGSFTPLRPPPCVLARSAGLETYRLRRSDGGPSGRTGRTLVEIASAQNQVVTLELGLPLLLAQ